MVLLLETDSEQIEAIKRLTRDLKAAARILTPGEARYLVDLYYQLQQFRIEAGGQTRAMGESGEPNELVAWMMSNFHTLESDIKRAMDAYSDTQAAGCWAKSIHGIGPVLAAGLLAHIDIEKAPTVGHIWRFAGLDPTVKWEKSQKRPWNARLKVLCWKIGQSFVKVSNSDKDHYGHVWRERKDQEILRNEAGEFAEQAAAALTAKRIGKDTTAYASYAAGKLPPAHIEARAERYAVKLFLSYYHHVAFESRYGTPPPKPYIIEHGGHVHFLTPPNWKAA